MVVIIGFILVAIFGVLVSFPMSGIIKRLSNEEKLFGKDFKKEMEFQPLLVIITSVLLIGLFYVYGFSIKFFIYGFIGIILLMDAVIDIKAQIIPNILNMVLFIVGIIHLYFYLVFDINIGVDLLLGMFVGGGIFALIALFALLVYRKEGMGLGDVKLMGALGLFLGAKNIFQIFILSFTIGAMISIILLITKVKKLDDYLAFGPFIVIATMITMFVPYSTVLFLLNQLMIGS